jgi:hypothetical protein
MLLPLSVKLFFDCKLSFYFLHAEVQGYGVLDGYERCKLNVLLFLLFFSLFTWIQGLLLRSLSSLVINCCALLNACPDDNVVMLDEVGSFFFHYGRTEFHYSKATKLQEFGKP